MSKFLIITLIIFSIPLISLAHSGRTDSAGCHTCRTNCPSWGLSYGEYHCHNAKILPQPLEPIKSHYGEYGTGYTTPAPEYKNSTTSVNNIDQIKSNINKEKLNYYKNPHRFREKLIDKIVKELGASKSSVAFYIYTMLLDVK